MNAILNLIVPSRRRSAEAAREESRREAAGRALRVWGGQFTDFSE